MFSTDTVVKVIGQKEIEAKLLAAAPRILEQNALMVTAMLNEIKPIVEAETPIGPGHFGYHARDRYRIAIHVKGVRTIGELRGAIESYWREFGTKGRFRRSALLTQGKGRSARLLTLFHGEGERAFMTAHKAASGVKRFIKFYYGGMAKWWRA